MIFFLVSCICRYINIINPFTADPEHIACSGRVSITPVLNIFEVGLFLF